MSRYPGTWTCIAALACAAVSPAAIQRALAQEYPNKPVHVVVPYAAGGGVDQIARLLQQRLSAALGQPVIVDNRAGAAGYIGAEFVSRAAADGYTLLFTVGADLALRQSKPGSLDLLRDFTPVASVAASVSCLAARADFPANSVAELMQFARRNPGKLTYGTSGIGSSQHLGGERLRQFGADMVHVPFKGVAPAMTALLAGQIDLAFTNLITAMPQSRQGKVKILALTQPSRYAGAPDIPSIVETLPGFDMPVPWFGYFGPPGLAQAIVARLNAEIGKSLEAPELKERIAATSMAVLVTTPEQFQALIRETASAYAKVIKAAGIQLD